MAQEVGYFENNVTYEEGPFVLVYANGWRTEVELKGHKCPVLLDHSIYKLSSSHFDTGFKTDDKELATSRVDWLNQQVKEDKIILHEAGYWYSPQHQ